jgi:hypothetical protein
MKEKERHMRTCEIQWFDKAGQLISDDNLSLGRVRVKKYSYEWRKWDNQKKCWLFGTMHFQPSKWFHICAEHAEWLNTERLPNAALWEWE